MTATKQRRGGRRRARALGSPVVAAWALSLATLLTMAAMVWLDQRIRRSGRSDLGVLTTFSIPPSLGSLTASAVGLVLASRRPRHPVGWLLLVLGLTLAVSGALAGYVPYGLLIDPGALPAVRVMALLYTASVVVAFGSIGLVLLLTPTGSPPSPRWRWWTAVTVAVPGLLPFLLPVLPGRFDPRELVRGGPLEYRAFGGPLRTAAEVALAVTLLGVVVAAASLVLRFRRAAGVERQQLRWVALAAALVGAGMLTVAGLAAVGNQALVGWVAVVCAALMPLSVGAAILRYRLYDLDRIISRTVVYGLLTVLLGAGYAGAVLLGGQLFGGLDDTAPSWTVAGATLAVAALFQPTRRRVQEAVDRRFNRRRYDAVRTIQGFSARLRQQVDLDALTVELLRVVDQTMQPTRSSVWLRPSPGPDTEVPAAQRRRPPP